MLSLNVLLILFSSFVGIYSQESYWDNIAICQNKIGRVAKLNSNCDEYYLCTEINDVIIASLYHCPNGSKFSPEDKRCVRGFECPQISTTVVDKNITWTTTSPIPDNIIKCNSSGNFVNPKSKDCSNYIQCALTNRLLVGKIISCPSGKSFSYTKLECVIEPKRCPPSDERTKRICKGPGRFLNDEDTTCTSYVLCIPTNNSNGDKFMVSQVYKCPGNTLFYVPESRCVLRTNIANYTCPIIATTPVPIPSTTLTSVGTTSSQNITTSRSNNGTTTHLPSTTRLPNTSTLPTNGTSATSRSPIMTSWPTQIVTNRTTIIGNITTSPKPSSTVTKPPNSNSTNIPTTTRSPASNETLWTTTSNPIGNTTWISTTRRPPSNNSSRPTTPSGNPSQTPIPPIVNITSILTAINNIWNVTIVPTSPPATKRPVFCTDDCINCIKTGLYPVDEDERSYFSCTRQETLFFCGKVRCEGDLVFNRNDRKCV